MQANANRLFLVGMVALLGVRVTIYLTEGELANPQAPEINKVSLERKLTVDSETYHRVRRLIEPRESFEESDYWVLAKFNMFDPRLAQSHEQVTQQANQLYGEAARINEQAKAALRAGNRTRAERSLRDALKAVNDALDRQPSHAQAQKLKVEIQGQLEALKQPEAGEAAPAATPTP
jgi:hypothetical protein